MHDYSRLTRPGWMGEEILGKEPVTHMITKLMKGQNGQYLVGGLEHDFYFSIYWECHHPN